MACARDRSWRSRSGAPGRRTPRHFPDRPRCPGALPGGLALPPPPRYCGRLRLPQGSRFGRGAHRADGGRTSRRAAALAAARLLLQAPRARPAGIDGQCRAASPGVRREPPCRGAPPLDAGNRCRACHPARRPLHIRTAATHRRRRPRSGGFRRTARARGARATAPVPRGRSAAPGHRARGRPVRGEPRGIPDGSASAGERGAGDHRPGRPVLGQPGP